MKQPKLSDLQIDAKGTKAIRAAMAKAKKVKITINVDGDLLTQLREISESSGVPYQTLMNKVLRQALQSREDESSRLDRLEKEFAKLKKQLSA